MTTLINEPRCKKLTFNADTFLVELDDGRELRVPLSYFPRLLNATPAQRKKFVISGGGIGLHWNELDEDISVRGLLLGNADRHRAL